ncbi:nuclear transport factor 2 family protein [Enterobacter mori]
MDEEMTFSLGYEQRTTITEHDKIAVRWRYQATHAKTGKNICSTYSSFYTIRDNKMYLIQDDTDTSDIIRQLS